MSDEAPEHRPALPPVAYPLLGLVFGGILVWSFSRVLLAVKKEWAPVIALLMALNVLIGAAVVAYGSRVRRRPTSFPLLVAGGAGVILIGVLALNLQSQPLGEAAGGPPSVAIPLVAQNTAFDKTTLEMPAGANVTIEFDNKDTGVPHNVVVTTDAAGSQPIFSGNLVTGPATANYAFTAPAQPGTLYFHCEVHPQQMKGTITVKPASAGGGGTGGGGGGGGGAGGGAQTIVAQNLAFDPTQLTVSGGGQVTIHFDNKDTGVPHNIHVFNGADANAPSLFTGDLVTGPAAKDYTFAAPPPGTYFFHCDVHPQQMSGKLVVK